jgi:hypothetical protein
VLYTEELSGVQIRSRAYDVNVMIAEIDDRLKILVFQNKKHRITIDFAASGGEEISTTVWDGEERFEVFDRNMDGLPETRVRMKEGKILDMESIVIQTEPIRRR